MNRMIQVLDVLASLNEKDNDKTNIYLDISLELSGLVVKVNIFDRSILDVIDSTVGNYQDFYGTLPLLRFSKSNLKFEHFLYAENIDRILIKNKCIKFKKIFFDLYFKENIQCTINNWNVSYMYHNCIIFCDDSFCEMNDIEQLVINDSFSFLIERNVIFGFSISFREYFTNWENAEKEFLSNYLSLVSKVEWVSKSENQNIALLKDLLISYNGKVFIKFIKNIINEIDTI